MHLSTEVGLISNIPQTPMSTGILKELLELFAHQVLYVRRVYDPNTFEEKRFCNTLVYKNRHPGVVSYIKSSVEGLQVSNHPVAFV